MLPRFISVSLLIESRVPDPEELPSSASANECWTAFIPEKDIEEENRNTGIMWPWIDR
jgi:hypothetical protein